MLLKSISFSTYIITRFSWMNDTNVDIEIFKTEVSKQEGFVDFVILLMKNIFIHSNTFPSDQVDKNVTKIDGRDSICLRFNVEREINHQTVAGYLHNAAEWVLKTKFTFSEDMKKEEQWYLKYKTDTDELFKEIIQKLDSNDYTHSHSLMNGMD